MTLHGKGEGGCDGRPAMNALIDPPRPADGNLAVVLSRLAERADADGPADRDELLVAAAQALVPGKVAHWREQVTGMLVDGVGFQAAQVRAALDPARDPELLAHAQRNALINLRKAEKGRHRLAGNYVSEQVALGARNAMLYKVALLTGQLDPAALAANPALALWARAAFASAAKRKGGLDWRGWLAVWWAYGKRDAGR